MSASGSSPVALAKLLPRFGLPDHETAAERRFLDLLAELQAQELGPHSLAFLNRILVQANLPYKQVDGGTFERKNGALTLTLQAPPHIGLPYGRYPRLLLAWAGAEAVRTRSRQLDLGPSLSAYLRSLGVTPSGGDHGPLKRFRDQVRRLFATSISCSWAEPGGRSTETGFRLAASSFLWWEPNEADPFHEGAHLVLSEEFFREMVEHPVPLDFRVLRGLTSPLALDVYAWLTYRVYRLDGRSITVPWESLARQFGTVSGRLRKFREHFHRALGLVLRIDPTLRVEVDAERGLTLGPPSRPHLLRTRRGMP